MTDDADRVTLLDEALREAAMRQWQADRENRRLLESPQACLICGEAIPEARQRAVPGVQFCVECQALAERQAPVWEWKP